MLASSNAPSRVRLSRLGRGQVAAERLLDNDAAPVGTAGVTELLDHQPKQGRRDGQVVGRPVGVPEFPAEGRERRRIGVVPVHVPQAPVQLVERRRVAAAVFLHARPRPGSELVEVPAGLGHADNRDSEVPTAGHRMEGREDLLVRQVAGGPEEHQGIGRLLVHRVVLVRVKCEWRQCPAGFSTWPPNSYRIADSSRSA